jgi:RHS repeat-associated protein
MKKVLYLLRGILKTVNNDLLDSNRDIGHDGLQVPNNLNRYFARDAVGYTLKYFRGEVTAGINGDYDAINKASWNDNVSRFEAYDYNSDLMNDRHDLFNGNVSAMVTNIQKPQTYSKSNPTQKPVTLPQGTSYNYDQLSRLIDMKAFQNLDSDNVWGTTGSYMGLYHNWLTYDANGNILTQKRADSVGNIFDSLTYQYNIQGGRTLQNRLYHVNDAANEPSIDYDIKDEGTFNGTEATINEKNNYRYNAFGQLAKDSIAGLDTIIWTLYNKIWKIKKHNGDSLLFTYDGKGNRVIKEYKSSGGTPVYTYYERDEKSNILAIYTKEYNPITSTTSYSLIERDIQGTDRLGTDNTPVEMIGALPLTQVDTFSRYLGMKEYELGNHLGNVLVTVSDRKIPRPNASITNIDHYEADIRNSNDYYPYGMLEPGRFFNSPKYRFGFNRKEKTDEIYGTADAYDYGDRFYDARLGRFLSVDPIYKSYPMLSPYQFASLSPIENIDLDGKEGRPSTENPANHQWTVPASSAYDEDEHDAPTKPPPPPPLTPSAFAQLLRKLDAKVTSNDYGHQKAGNWGYDDNPANRQEGYAPKADHIYNTMNVGGLDWHPYSTPDDDPVPGPYQPLPMPPPPIFRNTNDATKDPNAGFTKTSDFPGDTDIRKDGKIVERTVTDTSVKPAEVYHYDSTKENSLHYTHTTLLHPQKSDTTKKTNDSKSKSSKTHSGAWNGGQH